jgi:biopolymer transport protein ExbD
MPRRNRLFQKRDEPDLNMSSLIDIAFLLLIYFIVTSTLEKQESDLGLTLPGTSQAGVAPVQIDPMRIRIEANGTVQVNQDVLDTDPNDRTLPLLTERLQRFAASARLTSSKALILIDCADDAVQQRFIDVLNTCQNVGLTNISLAQ